jgi:hypothetical protein
MKRFINAAVAAAALVALGAPASASAQEKCLTKYQICVILPEIHSEEPCTTPVMPCVQRAVTDTFNTVDGVRALAQSTADYVIGLVDDPPDPDPVCYAIWGQPCSSELVTE